MMLASAAAVAVLLAGVAWWWVGPVPEPEELEVIGRTVVPVQKAELVVAREAAVAREAVVEPQPERDGRPHDEPPKPEPTPMVEPPCGDVAAQAESASNRRQWSRVLTLTRPSRCWDDRATRVWLRIEALSELRRYHECVELGASSTDPEVVRMARSCAAQLGEERSP